VTFSTLCSSVLVSNYGAFDIVRNIPDDKYKGHILWTLKKKYHLATKGVHDVQKIKRTVVMKMPDDFKLILLTNNVEN
jgi:hypothetical protein